MKSLILIAHGSRREISNREVRHLTERLRARAAARFAWVECAFLELAPPSIPSAIDAVIAAGAEEVVVLPYFLSAGRHVVTDIPALVEPKRAQYPRVVIRVTRHLGAADAIADLLLGLACADDRPG